MSTIGHNGIAADQLRTIIERIERLEEEKAAIAGDIKNVYVEAKGNGFDVAAIKEIVRLRKVGATKRQEHAAILETYKHALGMLADTPLGAATLAAALKEVA